MPFVGVHTVKAQYISTDVEVTYGSLETLVNQRVELTATNSGGTPPYTYQWYVNDREVQGAMSSKLEFIESTPGLYQISLGITDSLGNYTLATFMGAFFVNVIGLPTSSPSPTPSPPNISFLSLENKTYEKDSIPLNFTLSKPVQWVSYSLDGQANITIAGNTTISGLSNGLHNITIFAKDTFGNVGASETVYFTTDVPEPFPTILVLASILPVTIRP